MDWAKHLDKLRAWLILLTAAVLCVLFSLFEVRDIKALDVAPRLPVFWWGVGAGVVLLLASGLSYMLPSTLLRGGMRGSSAKVLKRDDGWQCRVAQTDVIVRFGRLEEVATSDADALVVLPANEFFDDTCVSDPKSTLGAFAKCHFDGREQLFLRESRKQLGNGTTAIPMLDGPPKQSFGVGTVTYLPRALGTRWNVLVAAVTTDRPREGLHAEIRTMFTVVQELRATMASYRLHEAVLPLIGAGHGGMRPRAALSALLVALIETLQRPDAHTMKSVTIVVFRREPKADPLIPSAQVRELMSRALDIYCCEPT